MTKRFNINAVTTFKSKNGTDRNNYTRCGTAFINTTQSGAQVINLKFDFIPVAAPGQSLELVCFEPKAKDDQGGETSN